MISPLFVQINRGDKLLEKIDTGILSRYINEDSLMTGRKVVYQRGTQTVSVKSTYGAKGASYDLVLRDANVENIVSVTRNTYHIVSIYRESRNLKQQDIVNKYGYYKDGSLRFKFTERDLLKIIPDVYPQSIKIGTDYTYSERGELQTAVDYNKEFVFDIYHVIRFYKRKIKERGLSVHQIFISPSSNPNHMDSYPLTGPYASVKSEHPYWKIETKDKVSGSITTRILDGRTGGIVSSFKSSLRVIE
jgi:hypothetical protein